MERLLAEDLVLLRIQPDTGRVRDPRFLRLVLGGALLTDLVRCGAIDIPGSPGLADLPDAPAERNLTWSTWSAPSETEVGVGATEWAEWAGRRAELSEHIFARLESRGLVSRARRRQAPAALQRITEYLVLPPPMHATLHDRWPLNSTSVLEALHEPIRQALLQGASAHVAAVDSREIRGHLLIALLEVTDAAHHLIEPNGLSPSEVKARARNIAREVCEGSCGGPEGRAVLATDAAVGVVTHSGTATGGV